VNTLNENTNTANDPIDENGAGRSASSNYHEPGFQERLRSVFSEHLVYKSAHKNKALQSLGIPSYLRDWLVKRFSDDNGEIDVEEVNHFVRSHIPRRKDWEALKSRMVNDSEKIRLLVKIRAEVDVKTGEGLFSLPDLGFPSKKYQAIIPKTLPPEKRDALVKSPETWGVIDLQWDRREITGQKEEGRVFISEFKPFCPYEVELDYYQEARREFSLDEWINILVMAIDYNPRGYLSNHEKLAMLARLAPLVERRLNLIELAPKGTGKSYLFSQISKHGWLVSGGSVSRARLFYDISKRTVGLVGRHDYVALDEIQSISFPDLEEIRGALKGYLESGEYSVGDYKGVGEAGLILLGNIDQNLMNENRNMFRELPHMFHESALLDRFHGFIRGWDIPRMTESMKAEGWGLNVEFFSEILHALRNDIRYRAIVDSLLTVPTGSDTRDTEAVKRITTAYTKLLFPHWRRVEDVDLGLFREYCLDRAMRMRGIIRKQLNIMDEEYSDNMPEIGVVTQIPDRTAPS